MKSSIFGVVLFASGCLYTGDRTLGLPCNTDTECGGTQLCVEHVCGGPAEPATTSTSDASGDGSSGAADSSASADDDDVRTQCEPSETQCLDDDVLRLCAEDGKLYTAACTGWCGQGTAHNGCQTTPGGQETCFCLNPKAECDTEGVYECDGGNILSCTGGFWEPLDCDSVCVDAGYLGADSCGPSDNGSATCFCNSVGCTEGARRCVDGDTAQDCVGGVWEAYDCDEVTCPEGTYSRGCTYIDGETESCGCWEE
jgi:hypothetical protein